MRKAFTIGITNNDQAEILLDHNHALREHKALSREETSGEYKEIFILESSRANSRKRDTSKGGGGVNHAAALSVADQGKKKNVTAVEKAMENRGNPEGKVSFVAARTVAEQQGRLPEDEVLRARRRGKKAASSTPARKAARSTAKPASKPVEKGDEGTFAEVPEL